MPVSTRQTPIAHRRIDFLSKEILTREKNPLYKLGEIPDEVLNKYEIHRIPFDFETLEDESVNLSLKPPVLFRPLSPSVLQKHPINPEGFGDTTVQVEEMAFRDYDPPHDSEKRVQGFWSAYDCASEVDRFLEAWCSSFPRTGVYEIFDLCQLRPIRIPNPFLLGRITCNETSPLYNRWSSSNLFETRPENENDVPANPHIILTTVLSCDGEEGSMQIGELASIIVAMDNRRSQPIAYGEEDEENIFENPEYIHLRQRAFDKEERFPVVMVSLLGPQHGRLFYACMDGERLVIRQSKLYSFERKDTAPWDFFTRFILSHPLKESSSN